MDTSGAEILRYAAFTVDGRGGNPAGVVLDASALSDAEMQGIAADVGYSETAFITARVDQHVTIRYFSPLAEVPFCGHATIATSVALAEREGPGTYVFGTSAGEVPIEVVEGERGALLATLTSVDTHVEPITEDALSALLGTLGWSRADLDPAYPPQIAFGGVRHPVLAVRERTTLAALEYDFDGLAALMSQHDWTTAQLVHAETPALFHARDPFPPGGVVEDPATGAAAAAFGGYLRDLGRLHDGEIVTLLQGYDNETPSRLIVELAPGGRGVRVTGTAGPIAQ